MSIDTRAINAILDAAAADGRSVFLEHEVYAVLEAAGCRVPRCRLAADGADPPDDLPGARVVLKVVADGVAHKSDIGGVAIVANTRDAIRAGMAAMRARVVAAGVVQVRGILVVEVIGDGGGGGSAGHPAETLVALRETREFGPVVTMGVGGVDTELLAPSLRSGVGVVSGSPLLLDGPGLLAAFSRTLAYRRLAGRTRAGRALVPDAAILRVLEAFRAIAGAFGREGTEPWTITELEVNPFAPAGEDLVALDGLLGFAPRGATLPARPLSSLDAMLAPRDIAIIGVSARAMNLGRIILGNIVGAGFDPERIRIVRDGLDSIDGIRCVPAIADLPGRVDLLVIAVGADQVPAVMDEVVEHDRATGVIVIPGGMAEKGGGEVFEDGLARAVGRARQRGLPLVVDGGNCLGIVSRPGRFDTLFIPPAKLPKPAGAAADVALVSQSGGFMITRLSKLPWLNPRYAISTGNQVDLTVADFVGRLATDPAIRVLAVYVEGFRDGDGLAFARAIRQAVAAGKDVIFYKAGRTAEGRAASQGHTASIAGDYAVAAEIADRAGALVAATLDEFQALLALSVLSGARTWGGVRLGAVSNAGYEAVAIADALRGDGWRLEAAALRADTRRALAGALAAGRADTLVDVRNPLDITPMADDAVNETVVRALLADPGVDVVLCSTVPLTDVTATLPGELVGDGLAGSMPARLGRLLRETDKPIVASVDAGALFDPFAAAFEERGVPVFRSVDAAVRAIGRYADARARRREGG